VKKYSLQELLSGEIAMAAQEPIRFAGVHVPMIQRDYAQGRKSEEGVRNRFLTALFCALTGGRPLTLDFVYGSVQNLDKQRYFVPLDGQQRLTTLFLLYWYIGNRELAGEEKTALQAQLCKFSYATRSTARDFCEKLASVEIVDTTEPGLAIRNLTWFYSSYQQDPTIQAMLEMLDAIHRKYTECTTTGLFPALQYLSFYVLPLDGFGLSDELYIKMNARGKQLTGFENFKADLIDWLRADSNPYQAEFAEIVALGGRDMAFAEAFTIKLDTTWTELFWRVARVDNTVDAAYMRFWQRFLLALQYVEPNPLEEEDALVLALDTGQYNAAYQGFALYGALLEKPGRVQAAARLLDKLSDHYDAIGAAIEEAWGGQPNNWHLLASPITQQQRILFLAVLRYLEEEAFDQQSLRQWLRVIWNISVDPDVRSADAMVAVMRTLEKLAKGAGDIYEFMLSGECAEIAEAEPRPFIKAQLAEERLKARLIRDSDSWEAALLASEKHPLFQGNIGFLLLGEPTLDSFQHRAALAERLFSGRGTQGVYKKDHLLLRSIISRAPSWDWLFALDMADEASNWRLLLRRKGAVIAFIGELVGLADEEAIQEVLHHSVSQPSAIKDRGPLQHVHAQLYLESGLQAWMQSPNVGATNLKWKNDHLYAFRYYGRENTRVMLDAYRNEIAAGLIEHLSFVTYQRCGNSKFFWGDWVTFTRRKDEDHWTVTAQFYDYTTLRIGVHRSDSAGLEVRGADLKTESDEFWLLRRDYSYADVVSETQAQDLVLGIKNDLFDNKFFHSRLVVLDNGTAS
jgi:Protein of unknown function DUF262